MLSIFALQPVFAVPVYLLFGLALSSFKLKDPSRLWRLLADFAFFCFFDSLVAMFIWYPVFDHFNKIVFWCWTVTSIVFFAVFSNFEHPDSTLIQSSPDKTSVEKEELKVREQDIVTDDNYFLTEEIEKIISSKSPRLFLVGPYGAGKETLATLNARKHSESVVIQRPSLTLRDFSHFINLLKQGCCLIFLDIHSYSKEQLLRLSDVCFQMSGRIILTAIRVFEENEFPAISLFDVEFIPALKPEQVKDCFAHFCSKEVEEVKWEGFADLTKLLYPPMVKEIVTLAEEQAVAKGEEVISKESLAEALTNFLNKPV